MLVLCAVWGVQQVASKAALDEGLPPITVTTPLAWALLSYQAIGVTFVSYLTWRRAALLAEPVNGSLLPGLAGSAQDCCWSIGEGW